MSEPLDPHDAETPVAPAAPKFELTDDGNQVKYGERTFVTQEALRQAREEARTLRDEFKKLEPVIPEFEEFIRGKQARQAAQRTQAAPREDEYTDDELDGFASVSGFYTQDNQPDRNRARQAMDVMSRLADRKAQKYIDPLRSSTEADRAARNRQEAKGRQFVDGQPLADQRFIDAAFDGLPTALAADPNVGNLAQVLAVGLQTLEERKNGTGRHARREPVFSEGGRGRYNEVDGNLSQFALAAARARGKSPEDWAKLAAKPSTSRGQQSDGSYVFEDL